MKNPILWCNAILTLLIFTATTANAQMHVIHYQQHAVKKGETAASIAAQNKLELKDFLLLNDLPADVKLTPGKVVLLRPLADSEVNENAKNVSGMKQTKITVENPFAAVRAEKKNGVEPTARIASKNKLEYGPGGIEYKVSKAKYHLVERKQTAYRIALIYGLTIPELLALNNLRETKIYIGQKLVVRKA